MNLDGATGWLVGEANKGMTAMFVMMNAARLGVGMQGLAIAEAAYQSAVAYARDRLQGRSLTGVRRTPTGRPIPSSCIPTCAAC
jgi:alkylation response protein AidB-like acyl-CoA dehydrogenase